MSDSPYNHNEVDWSDSSTDQLVLCMNLAMYFADYVKQVDPELWERARVYAGEQLNDPRLKFLTREQAERKLDELEDTL